MTTASVTVLGWAVNTGLSVVSGYPPVPVFIVYRPGTSLVTYASMAWDDAAAYVAIMTGDVAGAITRRLRRTRCHATHPNGRACRRWIYLRKGDTLDGTLGWRGYCAACVDMFRALCLGTHGRLPGAGEFFCPYCRRIRAEVDRCPREADGRRRIRCRACRHQQVAARRRARAAIAGRTMGLA